MKRHKHSLSHYHLTTCDMGKLIPIGLTEVLPGDTVQHATSLLVRANPLVAPVMHPVQVKVHHWFVPHRLVWSGWEDFITGGSDGMGGSAGAYPTIANLVAGVGDAADYLGIPTGTAPLLVSALPFRSYNLIFNEFYRDEDLVPEANLDAVGVHNVSWEKDYFTSSRPWTQKGPEVTLPLGTKAWVRGIGTNPGSWLPGPVTPNESGGNNQPYAGYRLTNSPSPPEIYIKQAAGAADEPEIYADLASATGTAVNDLRMAFALQRYQEARARYGSRYTEYLRFLGVKSSDARLQRPEYLGGGKQTITFSEVLQTGPGSTDGSPVPGGVGQFAGHGIAGMRSARYRRFFEEHGYVLSLLTIRPRTMYMDGVHRSWFRRAKEDYWQKELEGVGQQEIYRREVYADGSPSDVDVFGYQDRYSDYKHLFSRVSGEMRNFYDYWHLARKFAAPPVLNKSFVECDPTKRIFQEQTQHSFLLMANHSIQARRMVTRSNASFIR